jgi:hypothetical protein
MYPPVNLALKNLKLQLVLVLLFIKKQ